MQTRVIGKNYLWPHEKRVRVSSSTIISMMFMDSWILSHRPQCSIAHFSGILEAAPLWVLAKATRLELKSLSMPNVSDVLRWFLSPIANAITGNHLDRYFFNLRSLSSKILDSFFLLKVPWHSFQILAGFQGEYSLSGHFYLHWHQFFFHVPRARIL